MRIGELLLSFLPFFVFWQINIYLNLIYASMCICGEEETNICPTNTVSFRCIYVSFNFTLHNNCDK